MGWVNLHRPKGLTNLAYFTEEILGEDLATYEYIAAYTRRGVFYGALRNKITGTVTMDVIRFAWLPRFPLNFYYKVMDERDMPFYFDCPERLLGLLSETDNANALEWRARCRAVIARKREEQKIKSALIKSVAVA